MKLYLFSSTHWDREWYKPFQGFRFKLVRMIDDLIDGLETVEDYGVFHFDGQTIVLEDYLEIAPENKARLENLIRKGKLRVGPWYNMPDEYNVSGESMIKNLRRGFAISRAFGSEPMKLGYICDIFGHTPQMPQIFSQFDIHHIALGRGTIEQETPTFFRWQSPDGSEAVVWKLNDPYGYGTLSCNACPTDPIDHPDYRNHLKAVLDREMGRSDIPIVLLTDGQDHINMRKDSSRYLSLMRELYPGLETFHTAIEEVYEELDSYKDSMPLRQGELNRVSHSFGGLITNTLSSRYDCKQENDMLENRLELLISPAMALGLVRCREGFLRHAETFLLRNHPHDSICGCSVAQVHKDMHYRFDQANLICNEIQEELTAVLARRSGAYDGHDNLLRIYNPLPYERSGVQILHIDIPDSHPHRFAEPFGYEILPCFRLYDTEGTEIRYGLMKVEKIEGAVRCTLRASVTLCPMGVTELAVRCLPERTRFMNRMEHGARFADNGILRLEILPHGSVSITDHRTGRVYENLLTLLDDADIGDGWYHANPVNTETVTNTSCTASIIENNECAITFRVSVRLNIPDHLDRTVDRTGAGLKRSESRTDLTVTHELTLARGADSVAVRTTVDNGARDHRLKFSLPTGIKGDFYDASMAFAFSHRKVGVSPETETWLEYGVCEKQSRGIVAKADETGGFAFIAPFGFHECAVYEDGRMDMTAMRCFGKTPNGLEEGGQLQGKWEFVYALHPFVGKSDLSDLQRRRDMMAAGILCQTVKGDTPASPLSHLSLRGNGLCFSTADRYADHACVRIYNPTTEPASGTITVKGMRSAASICLDGRFLDALDVENETVALTLHPGQIFTLQINP